MGIVFKTILMGALTFAMHANAQRLPDGFYPESLAMAHNGTLYTGSATQSSIVRILPGAETAEPFIAAGTGGLMSVEGLLVDDAAGRLYACTADLGVSGTAVSPSALLAFDLENGAVIGRWPLPPGGFCNDIAHAPGRALFITDTSNARMLRFDPQAGRLAVWLAHPLLGGAKWNGNGVAVDGQSVFMSTFSDGRIVRIPILNNGSPGMPAQIDLPRKLDGADALRTLAPGVLLAFENDLEQGNGRVSIIDLRTPSVNVIPIAEGLREPVSGVVRDGRVILVESQFNNLFGSRRGQAPQPFALRTISLPNFDAKPREVALPPQAPYPNGIAHARDGTIYVGSITQGRIWRRTPRGVWETLFGGSPEIFAATSLRLDEARGLLWGTSPDFLPRGRAPRAHRIFAIDVNTGQARHSLTVPDGGFANDMAIESDGALLVTDSVRQRVLRVAPDTLQITTHLDSAALAPVGGIGAAGIAKAPDGRLIIGNYGAGRLYAEQAGTLRELMLPRLLENPDGLAFAPDGSLLVVEGAVASGNGKVLRIRDPFDAGKRPVEVLAYGLESPVNMTITANRTALITESKIRHRLIAGRENDVPDNFRMIELPLR